MIYIYINTNTQRKVDEVQTSNKKKYTVFKNILFLTYTKIKQMEKIYSIPFSNKAKQLDWFIMVELLERRYVVLLMFNPYAWIPPWLEFKNYSAYVRSSLDPFTLLIKKKKKKQRML